MKEHVLSNGVKIEYINKKGKITSFCIGFNAGALVEEKEHIGLAHTVEHMVFKGTKNRTEEEINTLCDEVFGFYNAMTNYPYVIYYGTTLSSDFEKGFEIYSDIVLNPSFKEEGFKEEKDIILEELKEWKDEPYQECEDELFYNAFSKRRIKELIIGNEESIKDIKLKDVKEFYNEHYSPKNCVISVVSSIEFERVIEIVEKYFKNFKRDYNKKTIVNYEENKEGIYYKKREGLKGAKIEYCFPIHMLNEDEIKLLKIFNFKFGQGTSSILYDEIRTKYGMAYEISSYVKNENGIKLFIIKMGTSVHNVDRCIKIINNKIEEMKNCRNMFHDNTINKIIKSMDLKKELYLEKSIQLAKELTTNKIMYGVVEDTSYEFKNIEINESKILKVIQKVLKKPTIQVLIP